MNLYVGNISFSMTEDGLRDAFEAFGTVTSVNIITDRETGRSRSLDFVEMASAEEGQAAIDGRNGTVLDGRPLRVNEAKPRESRRDNRGGGGGGGFCQIKCVNEKTPKPIPPPKKCVQSEQRASTTITKVRARRSSSDGGLRGTAAVSSDPHPEPRMNQA